MSSRKTLLQMAQSILTSMNSDDINSIDDTEEALEVVNIIEDTYYDLMSNRNWNHLKKPRKMEGLSDSDYPTTLKIPDDVLEISDLRYESRESASDALNYKKLKYLSPDDFTNHVLGRASTDDNVVTKTVKGSSTPLLVKTDAAPTYWTSFDETYIVTDSYDSDVESTHQESKSVAYCVVLPTFDATDDDYVPECPTRMFPTLLAEAKKACFFYLKDSASPVDAQRALRGTHYLKNRDYRAHDRRQRVNFGRK